MPSDKVSKTEKRDAIKTAKELFYSKDIIERIKNATSSREIERALIDGRKSITYTSKEDVNNV